jgi:hypothetical protein
MLQALLDLIQEKRNKSAKIAVKIMVKTVQKHNKRVGSIEVTLVKSRNQPGANLMPYEMLPALLNIILEKRNKSEKKQPKSGKNPPDKSR